MWGVPVLGTGNGGSSTTPVPAQIDGVARIAGGYEHTCALKTNGEVWCWGEDALGELGDGPKAETQLLPVQVTAAPPGG
jgi:alpha-tubulin suppressor-like RCC1 family protein